MATMPVTRQLEATPENVRAALDEFAQGKSATTAVAQFEKEMELHAFDAKVGDFVDIPSLIGVLEIIPGTQAKVLHVHSDGKRALLAFATPHGIRTTAITGIQLHKA